MTKEEIEERMSFPRTVHLESTNACNSRCNMCPIWKMEREKETLRRDLFTLAVDECSQVRDIPGIRRLLHLHQNGEPLMVGIDEIVWRINYAKSKLSPAGWSVGFYTNGSLLNKECADKLLKTEIDHLQFSFDGGTKEDYESIRRELDFDSVVQNIKYFYNKRKELRKINPHIIIMFIPQKLNEDRIQEFYKLFRDYSDIIGTAGAQNYAGEIDNQPIMHRHQYRKGKRTDSCIRLWDNFYVMSNGLAAICPFDFEGKVIIGDLRINSIQEIWQSEILNDIREKHLEHRQEEIDICWKCDYMEGCVQHSWYLDCQEELIEAIKNAA